MQGVCYRDRNIPHTQALATATEIQFIKQDSLEITASWWSSVISLEQSEISLKLSYAQSTEAKKWVRVSAQQSDGHAQSALT